MENKVNIRKIDIQVSPDNMAAFIKLEKNEENLSPPTKEEMMASLTEQGIVYGIRDTVLEKLAVNPVYAFRMEVAKGLIPIPGKDGRIVVHVKKDKDYTPNYNEEGTVDYKNIDYFQLAKKGQTLCEIFPPEKGVDGLDVFGKEIPCAKGKEPAVPLGDNTSLSEDKTCMIAECDGLVKYVGSRIDISEMLNIRSSVNNLTGNIKFPGDVTITGDVCNGITVKAGGNVIIKGVIEDASVEAGGSIHVMNGINGDGKNRIMANKGLTCKYIENAIIKVTGNIVADYVVDCDIICQGDIVLTGTKEVLLGGNTKLSGELRVRDIGNSHERHTRIEILGVEAIDERRIQTLTNEKNKEIIAVNGLIESAGRIASFLESGRKETVLIEQLIIFKQQIKSQTERIQELESDISLYRDRKFLVYEGYITCKRKIYQGVKIYFGEHRFQFNLDNIEHCRIYWYNDEIVQNTL